MIGNSPLFFPARTDHVFFFGRVYQFIPKEDLLPIYIQDYFQLNASAYATFANELTEETFIFKKAKKNYRALPNNQDNDDLDLDKLDPDFLIEFT